MVNIFQFEEAPLVLMCKLFSIFQKGVSVSVFALLLTSSACERFHLGFAWNAVWRCVKLHWKLSQTFHCGVCAVKHWKDMAVREEGSVCVLCLTDKNRMQAHRSISHHLLSDYFFMPFQDSKGCVIQPAALCIFPQAQSKIYISTYLYVAFFFMR